MSTAVDAAPFASLARPGHIGRLELRNRAVKSPQATATANQDGTVTQRTVDHYRRLGEGGTGLVMVEYTHVDDDASKAIHNQIGLSRREHVAGLGWLADVVRSTGAKVGIQLAHGGRQKFLGTRPLKSASTSSWSEVEAVEGNVPVPMTAVEIHRDADLDVAAGVTTRTPATVRPEDVGSCVVVVGGGFQGCECALRIAREVPSATVTLVEQHESLQQGDEVFTDLMALPRLLAEAGVDVRTGTRATGVTVDGVSLADGELLEADTVVLASGRREARDPLRQALAERGQQVVTIGSADRSGRVFDAVHSAFFTGRQL
ncbi:oxidoreductase [Janibacter limosus]|uniref:oxidoreductase n=1 Tax=Janibacter limosus TaxID=53458 RepID=UPI000834CE1C|nr:FAD-dependent oxidoreductase [Janibacter limosus]